MKCSHAGNKNKGILSLSKGSSLSFSNYIFARFLLMGDVGKIEFILQFRVCCRYRFFLERFLRSGSKLYTLSSTLYTISTLFTLNKLAQEWRELAVLR